MLMVLQLQPFGWAKGSIAEQRARQEKLAKIFKISKDIKVSQLSANGVPVELIDVVNSRKGIILYLHGGAYAVGSAYVHREFLSRLAKSCQTKVLAINYRLAPENPFPAALEDSITAYKWLVSRGFDPSTIVIAGDSAGGGLAIATLVALRDNGTPLPACAVCISPWVNLSHTGEKPNNNNDPILNPEILAHFSRDYAGQTDICNPLISPVFADLKELPPLLIHAGTDEILIDQVKQIYENARQAGVEIVLDLWDGMFHVFQIIPILPESKRSLEKIASFINKKIHKLPATE